MILRLSDKKKMKKYILISFSVLFLAVTPVSANTKNIKIDVGGLKIDIHAPEGFHEVSSISPETRELAEIMTPPENRLLAVFISDEDLRKITNGEKADFNRYMLLQVYRKTENTNVSPEQFQKISSQIKEQQNTLLVNAKEYIDNHFDGVTEKLSKESDVFLQIKIGEQIPLGIFLDKQNALGFANLSKYMIEENGQQNTNVLTACSSVILIKDKLLFSYVYSNYKAQNDIIWAKSTSKEWVNSLLTANLTSRLNSSNQISSSSGIDLDKITRKVIGGTILGGLTAISIWLFRGMARIFKRKK